MIVELEDYNDSRDLQMLRTNDPSVNQHKKKLIINTTTLLSFLSLDTMEMLYVT